MQFTVNFEINGEPATWADILARARRTAKAAASATADMSMAFEHMRDNFCAMNEAAKRRKVDDFIRWLAKHQDDEVTA